jgi:asparagine synthase (glutamine-hydrolysing)
VVDDSQIIVLSSGEIFNEDITDVNEHILKLYTTKNLSQLRQLNGSFVALIYDQRKRKFILVNDRNGSIKIFYYYKDDQLYFSPKIRSLLSLNVDKQLRQDAIIDFFLFGYLLEDKTLFEYIHQLPPGTILECSKDELIQLRYWDYKIYDRLDMKDRQHLIDQLSLLWDQAMKRRMDIDKTSLILSSGGLDSRAVLASISGNTSRDNVIAFTFGLPGSFDFEIGRMVAEYAGCKHVPLPVEKDDFRSQYDLSFDDTEGMIDATPYLSIKKFKEIKDYGNTLFTGYMGGELMGPLIFHKIFTRKIDISQNIEQAKKLLLQHHQLHPLDMVKKLLRRDYFPIDNILSSFEHSIKDIDTIDKEDYPNFCAAWMYNNENDKYTAYCNFRFRNQFRYHTPFLDNDLMDFVLRLAPEERKNKSIYISMLLEHYPDFFHLPIWNRFGLPLNADNLRVLIRRVALATKVRLNRISTYVLKRNVFQDQILNYMDYNDLLRTNQKYQEFLGTMLGRVKKREFFNSEYIDLLWELHLSGKKNYAKMFGLLVTFELFMENFVDR